VSSEPRGQPSLVDWGLAQRLAVTIAGTGPEHDAVGQVELDEVSSRAMSMVIEYTGMEPLGELPRPEAVDRPEWIRANLAAFRSMSGDLERRLADSIRLPEPFRGVTRTLAGTVGGAEVGLVLGYVARKVLGQYDLAVIGPTRTPRLLFVRANLAQAHRRLGGDRSVFLHWIALHEATHAVQFASVPWLRVHLGGMVEELLEGATLGADMSALRAALRRALQRPDPGRLARQLRQEGLVQLLSGPRQAALLRRLQATMAVIEGHAEHVMDAIGARLDPGYARLRDALEAEREQRSPIDVIVMRLLGLDMKLRQYRLGKRFADSVTERSGIQGLNEVWREPGSLPDSEELREPDRWMSRVTV
jgi:coenzyme F420 biosynthesis associated uncharacterized protein